MMAFLQESFFEHPRVQNQVGINSRQIIEIRLDLTGNRVKGFVRVRKRIDKRLHGGTHQLFEGIFERIFFRTCQHGVFQNMGQTRGIRGRRAKANRI